MQEEDSFMNQEVRLERVQITNLFHRFSYDINFQNGNNISILTGPNGCGKTTIFNLIEFIFNYSTSGYKIALTTPFDVFKCYLSNGHTVSLRKKKRIKSTSAQGKDSSFDDDDDEDAGRFLEKSLYSSKFDLVLEISKPNRKTIHSLNLSNKVKKMIKEYGHRYIDEDDVNIILYTETIKDVINDSEKSEYPRWLHRSLNWSLDFIKTIKAFLLKNNCELKINFIRSTRIHKTSPTIERRRSFRMMEIPEKELNPLNVIQKRMQQLIKKITDDYSREQNKAKDLLPNLYLNKNHYDMSYLDFKNRWNNYIANVKKYHQIGLIEQEYPKQILNKNQLEEAFEKKGAFLGVYLELYEKAIDPLEHEYTKLKLFKDILDSRNKITKKIFLYSKEGIIVTVDGEQLPLECLSSGEKNDFVMFYNLIFGSPQNSLVLVDEPEISLHIEWQEDYLDRLIEICEMNHLQAIVATHSPNIINGHRELIADKGLAL